MLIKLENGQPVSYSFRALREANPNTSWPKKMTPEVYASYGVYVCTADPMPAHDQYSQIAVFDVYYQTADSEWRASYKVEDLPQDIAEANVRGKRNELLAESDWTQVADAPVDQAAWATYRQALRDIPQQPSFPYGITWPTEPTS
jgi:hypothetical protein